jgi:MFS family permease
MTVFTLSWGTSSLGYNKTSFLIAQMISMVFFGLGIPFSAILADKIGRNSTLILATVCIIIFGLFFSPLFSTGSLVVTTVFLCIGMFCMGLTYGPIGTALAEIFPASVRYTGSSLAFTLAGILGASLTPLFATTLATKYGLYAVGYYLAIATAITLLGLFLARPIMKKAEEV